MRAILIFMKCELGKAYDVAVEAVDTIEQVSEAYSTSGQYDLFIKCYLPEDEDIGRFVTGTIQTLPHVKDTYTVLTFNAFT